MFYFVVNLLLCLFYKLSFIIGMYMQENRNIIESLVLSVVSGSWDISPQMGGLSSVHGRLRNKQPERAPPEKVTGISVSFWLLVDMTLGSLWRADESFRKHHNDKEVWLIQNLVLYFKSNQQTFQMFYLRSAECLAKVHQVPSQVSG